MCFVKWQIASIKLLNWCTRRWLETFNRTFDTFEKKKKNKQRTNSFVIFFYWHSGHELAIASTAHHQTLNAAELQTVDDVIDHLILYKYQQKLHFRLYCLVSIIIAHYSSLFFFQRNSEHTKNHHRGEYWCEKSLDLMCQSKIHSSYGNNTFRMGFEQFDKSRISEILIFKFKWKPPQIANKHRTAEWHSKRLSDLS